MTSVLDLAAEEIERRTDLEKLEARGTVRLALKQAGLAARTVTAEQMAVVVTKVLPAELRARGVLDPDGVCEALARALDECDEDSAEASASPEAIFRRLAES